MRKVLKFLKVVQTVSNEGRAEKLGRGFSEAHRINPYNPISYIVIPFAFIIGIILFGVVGVWNEIDKGNPFKWN